MASKEALKCVVFLGSVRENNMGSRAAKFIVRKLTASGFSVNLLGELKSNVLMNLNKVTQLCNLSFQIQMCWTCLS